jgi:hypothetical protein
MTDLSSMSSADRLRRIAAVALSVASILSSQSARPGVSFGCPAAVEVSETAVAVSSWHAEPGPKTRHNFLRPSLYNGTPAGKEFELAPDDQQMSGKRVTQIWKLPSYRDMNLFVRCRYLATPATMVANLPAQYNLCEFKFRNTGGNQPIADPSFECR